MLHGQASDSTPPAGVPSGSRRTLHDPLVRSHESEPRIQPVGVLGGQRPAELGLGSVVDRLADQFDPQAAAAVLRQDIDVTHSWDTWTPSEITRAKPIWRSPS